MEKDETLTKLTVVLNKVANLFVKPEMLANRPYEAFRILLVVGLIINILGISSIFGIFHLLYTGLLLNMWLNLGGSLFLIFLLFIIYKNKALGWVGHAFVLLIFLFFPIFIVINQAEEYSMFWIIFVPFTFIAILGRPSGVWYSLAFFLMMFVMAYQGIGVWDNGNWSLLSYGRFVVASLLGIGLAIVIDMANVWLNQQVENQKNKERSYVKELRRLSTTDALTDIFNRHYFKQVLEEKLDELKHSNAFLTFFIIDIDYFKLYNDEYGHQRGDEVLHKVAQTIRHYVKRREDLVFRLGGEEFGGLVISDHPKEIANWLLPLKEEIEALKIKHAAGAPEEYITISMGIYSSKINDVKDIDKLYSVADKALYKAKRAGRNQVCIADE